MPIPVFVTGGILPTGIHECDLAEIEQVFVYNDRRRGIWNSFKTYLSQVAPIPDIDVIYIDGSFVTDRDLPNDIDLVLEFADVATLEGTCRLVPHLFDRATVKTKFILDLLFAIEPLPLGLPDLREFFQYLRPEEVIDRGVPIGTRKGILKISLNDERQRNTI